MYATQKYAVSVDKIKVCFNRSSIFHKCFVRTRADKITKSRVRTPGSDLAYGLFACCYKFNFANASANA